MDSISYKTNMMVFFLYTLLFISCSREDTSSRHYLNFKMQTVEKKSGDCDSEDAKCASILLKYPVFNDNGNKRINTLNNFFLELILNGGYEEGENVSIDDLCKAFFDDYNSMLEDFQDYSLAWELERTIKVVHNSKNYISTKYHEYSFSGGAHPNYTTTFFSYNLNRQKFIQLKDLFHDPQKNELINKIAEEKFRQQKNISSDADLGAEGFWFESNKFSLNENFAVADSGIIFFFNSYEIAPYSMGTTEILLQYDQINNLLPSDFEK